MANVEQFIQEDGEWRPMKNTDLNTVTVSSEPSVQEIKYRTDDGDFVGGTASAVIYAVHVTFKGASNGDTITIQDGSSNPLLNFTAGMGDDTYSFTPSVGIPAAGIKSVSSLTGSNPISVTVVYKTL